MKNCPCCGTELAKGYIHSNHRIRWTTADRDFSGFLNETDGEFWLRSSHSFGKYILDGYPVAGYRCPSYNLILLPQKEDETI